MLKVIDGLVTLDGANFTLDIPYQSVAAQVNATGVDMSGHNELLAVFLGAARTGLGTLACLVQESNELAANYANVTSALQTINAANQSKLISVDWRKPGRKRYGRLSVINSTNAVAVSAISLRVGNRNAQGIDAAAVEV